MMNHLPPSAGKYSALGGCSPGWAVLLSLALKCVCVRMNIHVKTFVPQGKKHCIS